MKRNIIFGLTVILVAFGLVGCTKNVASENPSESDQSIQESEVLASAVSQEEMISSSVEDDFTQSQIAWPVEFEQWGIPIIKEATVSLADNRSSDGSMLTQGVTAIVNLQSLKKDVFDSYCKELESNGFELSPDSLEDVLIKYDKSITNGSIELLLCYSEDTTTITASNSTIAAQKDAAAGGNADWPEALTGVPEFSRGNFKETVDMGGNMYTITYNDVTDEDIDWYRGELLSNGFELQPEEDTEGYMKVDTNITYSVGMVRTGNAVQIVVFFGTY